MKDDAVLRRLAALRRQSEQRAMAAVVLQDGLCRRAEARADEAAGAVSRHVTQALARERKLIEPLVGRPVRPVDIGRVQAVLDRVVVETVRLRTAAAHAQASLLKQRVTRAEAHEDFRLRQREVAKLDLLLAQEKARQSRRAAALTEADDEDRCAAMAGRQSS